MTRPLEIQVLVDGKPGHENQSFGLVEAIGRLTPVEIHRLSVGDEGIVAAIRTAGKRSKSHPAPSLLVGAGHSVHAPLLSLARSTGAPCVVMMKPSLPVGLFDLCLIPLHDQGSREVPPNVIATRGAINRVPAPDDRPRHGGLILIGGPSGTHGWDSEKLVRAVTTIVTRHASLPWRITNSRRTPADELGKMVAECPALVPFPYQETGRDWLPQRLAEAIEVWVTEDSVSMIYEALSSGARVGLLPVPRLKKAGRVARGVDRLVEDGFLTCFDSWQPGNPLPSPPFVLNEAERCARLVLERFFPDRLPAR